MAKVSGGMVGDIGRVGLSGLYIGSDVVYVVWDSGYSNIICGGLWIIVQMNISLYGY